MLELCLTSGSWCMNGGIFGIYTSDKMWDKTFGKNFSIDPSDISALWWSHSDGNQVCFSKANFFILELRQL